jgi:hypothetical protein
MDTPELGMFLGLVKAEPAWRQVTLDHADVRLGGYVIGGEPSCERLIAANRYEAEEVGLPAAEVGAFFLREGVIIPELRSIRRHRASRAIERLARPPGPCPGREAFDWRVELETAAESPDGEEVEPGAEILCQLLESQPGPWELTQVVRSRTSGGLWAFGVDVDGEVVIGAHDVEARRAGQPASLLWLPDRGRRSLEGFLLFRHLVAYGEGR